MTLADHYNAFKGQMDGGGLAGKVSDGVRLNGSLPVRAEYAILKPTSPLRRDGRFTSLDSVESTSRFRFDVRWVGRTLALLLPMQQEGQERLIPEGGVRLEVPGRRCDAIRLVDPVEEGEYAHDPTANLFYVDETYEFWSHRE